MALFQNVFNHLVLPPQIPGNQDADLQTINNEILGRLIHATSTLGKLAGQEHKALWKAVRRCLHRCQSIHTLGFLERSSLLSEFERLEVNEPLVLHVTEQNAALIIRRDVCDEKDVVVFEAFETSPPSADVLACERALLWEFPDCAAQIPLGEFQKQSFQDALVDFLEKSSLESLRQFQAFASKAQTSIVESRDTANPALMTHLLIPLIEALGSPAQTQRFQKRIRDDVNFQAAEFPWRRLPFWLVLRVFTQRLLHLSLGYEAGRASYKFLISTMLIDLLNECPSRLAPEMTMTLRAKVCRRLAKLEQDKSNSPTVYSHLFAAAGPFFQESIEKATSIVEAAWDKFKRETTRPIHPLPSRADQQSLCLSLPNSGTYLQCVLNLPRNQQKPKLSWSLPSLQDGTIQQVEQFTDTYFELAKLEKEIETNLVPLMPTNASTKSRCIALAEAIANLFKVVGSAYNSDPEQTSAFILSLFTLWVRLDKETVKICPLLGEYHPIFTPELLDPLNLPMASQMRRLRDIQAYIHQRCEESKRQSTIFSEPDKHGFTVKYVTQSAKMQTRLQQVQKASDDQRKAKEVELDTWQTKFDEHSLGISSGTCVCSFNYDGSRNVRGCTKCWHWRARNRMDIYAHEDFLPENAAKASAVIFELSIPDFIAAYRSVTWKIVRLAYPDHPALAVPTTTLCDYEPLKAYQKNVWNDLTLASTTKSFRGTHYKVTKKKMKASKQDVLFPNGLTFLYFDTISSKWIRDFSKPLTFQHVCGIHVPLGLRQSIIPELAHPPTDLPGPSSYEIVASETKCPSDMAINEFTTYQRLLSGKTRRWFTMLVELGASDLNFSSETTMRMFNQLATQAGPRIGEPSYFRDVHVVFKDISFCNRLAEQIGMRLRNISSNWREVHCMDILITISLRLFALCPSKSLGYQLLKDARAITLKWFSRLRADVRTAKVASAAETAANYAFWAALLCRRTFSTFTESDETLMQDDLSTFVQASLALQENLLVDLTKLSPLLRLMLIRDAKMAYALQPLILRSIKEFPDSIGMAINASWSNSGASTEKTFARWQTFSSPHDRWVVTTMSNTEKTSASSQVAHYNFVEGHLLINGQPLGRLPHDIRESDDVKQLFGDQHLLTFPSAEVGMSYVMLNRVRGHEIHFGYRNQKVIIRARNDDGLFEFIPRDQFEGLNSVDLPSGLVHGCVHWLNLRTKCLEVRRQTVPWRTRLCDWTVDVRNRSARRKDVYLVDPNSTMFKHVADIFRQFEDPRRITVFQPVKPEGVLSVELRHLELSFFVNRRGFLQSRELSEEIDPNQDAGTLYGLQSKIVLRSVRDRTRRSIIVAWGKISTKRRGMHVDIRAASTNEYARFGIDVDLGKLSCPAEPRLLYAKALYHAYTSFVIPDPLTGRTGTEEALHILQSAYSQPWQPLGGAPINILSVLGSLSPRREYYPKDRKNLQSVYWNTDLTMTIQHDAFEQLVQGILCKSERLRVFAPNKQDGLRTELYQPNTLRRRGVMQRCLYECSTLDKKERTGSDIAYQSRGQQASSAQACKVYQITRMLRANPFKLNITRELYSILQDWPLIGGFHRSQDSISVSLSDAAEKNVDEQWGSLVNACRKCDADSPHSMVFRLCLMSLNSSNDMNLIKMLAAFAVIPELKTLQPPSSCAYSGFKLNETPTVHSLFKIISVDLPETPMRRGDKAQETHRKACEAEGKRLARHFLEQWPNDRLFLHGFDSDVINAALAMERLIPEWRRLHANMELSEYVIQAQHILKRHKGPQETSELHAWALSNAPLNLHHRCSVIPSIVTDLLIKPLAEASSYVFKHDMFNAGGSMSTLGARSIKHATSKEASKLREILSSFTSSSNTLRQEYGRDLDMSLVALENTAAAVNAPYMLPEYTAVSRSIQGIRAIMKKQRIEIRDTLAAGDDRFKWLDLGNLWPCNTSLAFLEQLRSSSNHVFGAGVKEAIVSHGVLLTKLQRLLRLRSTIYQGWNTRLQEELKIRQQEELKNPGHENWDPVDYPDWLLLEIDSNIMIRREQVDVAHAIIAPGSGENTVLQLNMGKGKTSCIVPMAMAILGNGKQLVRLIVPKPLLLPTAQMIQSRLGGLVSREIRHIPFSRRTDSSPETLQLYKYLHQDLLNHRGVVLNAPEHILSFKLSGLQHLASSKLETAQEMIDFQNWLTGTCRDVLDESDVSLAVKTQLIYPSGEQNTVDGHPQRWQVAQSLLSRVEDHLPYLQQRFPQSIEVIERPQGYPMVFFLQPDVEECLHERIVEDICTGRTPFLRLANPISREQVAAMRKVLLDAEFDEKTFKRVTSLFADKQVASKSMLLVRGLLLNRILLICLKKRWNVQYGLHPKRDPVAVPFEAKSVPSEQAEFGHPDVAILLTCLAFYYNGLNKVQFSESLHQILSSHDPSSEYDRWISACDTLPDALSHWNVINVDDQGQIEELWTHLKTSRPVANYFMNHFVFPAHAKQFGIKLQASGWDLPLFMKTASSKNAVVSAKTTGFSGTNDNKIMLPLTIRQDDLSSLHHTNAEVLTYFLQNRNQEYQLAAQGGKRLSETDFLWRLKENGIRILIDAGAYILEMSNEALAKAWMDIDPDPKAAVFYGADNRATVLYRGTKKTVPLLATPFADNLDHCLVYFDEAHTRGVDLKLPQYARGALTLALGQTKDHTVQAAMRLRQLATTQSVTFFAFPETHQSILDICGLNIRDKIDSSHVVHWLLEQTCRANEQVQSLYISQGRDFCNRTNAEWEHADLISEVRHREAYVKVLQRPEQQTLEQLYGNGAGETQSSSSPETEFTKLQVFMEELTEKHRAASSQLSTFDSSALDEVEQEREVEFQVEEVREVQKPVHYKPLVFPGLHPAISAFVDTGALSGGEGYEHVLAAVSRTSMGQKFGVSGSTSQLFVSEQFMRTIKTGKTGSIDNFQRPVEWILYNPKLSIALVIIAEEAELLIPKIRAQKSAAKVHILTYSAPVTKKMLRFSTITYYSLPALPAGHTIPHWLTIELGIFAGRLYMNFDQCGPLVEYIENKSGNVEEEHGLGTNPISFLVEWTSLRRRGQDIIHTPMGYICHGRTLDRGHGFFVAPGVDNKAIAEVYPMNGQADGESDEEGDDENEWDGVEDLELA